MLPDDEEDVSNAVEVPSYDALTILQFAGELIEEKKCFIFIFILEFTLVPMMAGLACFVYWVVGFMFYYDVILMY